MTQGIPLGLAWLIYAVLVCVLIGLLVRQR
jgi:hypothetical protein